MPCPLEASLPPQPSNNTSLHTPPPRTFAKMNRNLVQIAHSSSRRQRPSHTGSLHSELLCVCVCCIYMPCSLIHFLFAGVMDQSVVVRGLRSLTSGLSLMYSAAPRKELR